ncbi:MAG: NifB/NifX family molybdenum-iron cluster-binding protein, partial [Anaerolineales bacterium]|nr:NifB/NifX family molybdenum-iron cluster-binding protein [Anaerolineales bacterium]
MRIAISSEEKNGLDSLVSHHFGRCPCYVLVDVDEDQKIQAVQALDNPFAIQHQPGMVPGFIHDQGADVMISGGMGRRAIGFFQEYGIQVATGA